MNNVKQRGSAWSINLVIKLYDFFGYRFIFLLMYPVTFFYFLFASNVKAALKDYYKHIGEEFTLGGYFTHLRIFANCMVDRFISKLTDEKYEVEYEQGGEPFKMFEDGCIIVQSHYGGWAATGNIANDVIDKKMNIVMQEVMLGGIQEIEKSTDNLDNINVIDLSKGGIAVSIEIAQALERKELVSIMGDRAFNQKSLVGTEFFGSMAGFNQNPFKIAYKTKKNILVYFSTFLGEKKYKVEYYKIDLDYSLKENEAVKIALDTYAKHYEKVIQNNPNQWFNFYNFWEKENK